MLPNNWKYLVSKISLYEAYACQQQQTYMCDPYAYHVSHSEQLKWGCIKNMQIESTQVIGRTVRCSKHCYTIISFAASQLKLSVACHRVSAAIVQTHLPLTQASLSQL